MGLVSGACATYYDRIEAAHDATDAGQYSRAVAVLSEVMGTTPDGLPGRWSADAPLAALERGVLLQAMGEHARSSRDLSAAETELEFLDMRTDTTGNIGKYVYSDSSQVYKVPPSERLALNAVNMLNYLAHGDLQGASVEARRFTVMREYLDGLDKKEARPARAHGAFGSYLSGFTFERLGETERALRYYDEALMGTSLGSLEAPVLELAGRGEPIGPNLAERLGEGTAAAGARETSAEILVVLGLGRVPHKEAERMAIGAAVGIAGTWVTGRPELLSRSVTKVVVYPELQPSRSLFRSASVSVDGRPMPVVLLTDLGAEIRREYAELKPRIIGAALTRLIARAAAAEGVRSAGGQQGSGFGLLAALIAEGTLVALDRPDTRSWTFLPERIFAARTRVPPGRHEVLIRLGGGITEQRSVTVTVEAGGFVVLPITAPR